MTAPGTQISLVNVAPPTGVPTETDAWFIVGFTEKGVPATQSQSPVTSMNDFVTRFGNRISYGLVYDAAETFFAEGGRKLYVSRVVGPGASGDLSLSATDDDHTNAVEADWTTALGYFGPELGPGQVSMPGRTTSQAYSNLVAHAAERNRVAILDGADTATAATLTTASSGLKAAGNVRGGFFAPWVTIPGVTPGTSRTIPPSPVVAGIMARNDRAGQSPNVAGAGSNGVSKFATGLSQAAWDDTTRGTLNDGLVNVLRSIYGGVRVYGFRSLSDPALSLNWLQLTGARLYMAVNAQLQAMAEEFVFDEIDGQGKKLAEFKGALIGLLLPLWADGSLYGASPDEAFRVVCDTSNNTPTTIGAGELHADVGIRVSPFAEFVYINVAKTPVTQALA